VLFCYENDDEYVNDECHEFDGKRLLAADHTDVKRKIAQRRRKAR